MMNFTDLQLHNSIYFIFYFNLALGLIFLFYPFLNRLPFMYKQFQINRIKCKIAGLEAFTSLNSNKDRDFYSSSELECFSLLASLKERLNQLQSED